MIPELLLILSLMLCFAGAYLEYGLPTALMLSGGYIGVISFTMAHKRGG